MARLRRSDTSAAGLRRAPRGRGFRYRTAAGSPVTGADLDRIRQLVIPPAWTDVWICPFPNGHLQATGVDAAGRRQYLYHADWRIQRDREKFDHVLSVADGLPAARQAACAQLADRGLTRLRVLAAAFVLLDVGLFRIGGDRYAEENGSYGLMTLQREHVHCTRGGLVFEYPAKSGKERAHVVPAESVRAAVCALRRKRPPGQRLLAFAEHGQWHELDSDDLNAYLRELFGQEVSAKDLQDLARDRAGRGGPGRFGTRRGLGHSPQAGGQPHRQGGGRVPGQYSGRVPQLLHRPAADRPVPGRRKDQLPDGPARRGRACRLAGHPRRVRGRGHPAAA